MKYSPSRRSPPISTTLSLLLLSGSLGSLACTGKLLQSAGGSAQATSEGGGSSGVGDKALDPSDPWQVAQQLKPKRESGLQRLSKSQYVNTVADLFSPGVAADLELELDYRSAGFTSIGGREVAISRSGVRKYESAARLIAERVVADADLRASLSGCLPTSVTDSACLTRFVATLGRRLFRRPLTGDESRRYLDVAAAAAEESSDFWQGAKLALTGMLLSPHFLYQVEIGVERDGERLLTDLELATRLSFFLWDSAPDEQLLTAAEQALVASNIGRERSRLLADATRLSRGIRAFGEGLFALHRLDSAPQSVSAFPQATPALYASMKEAVQLLTLDVAIQQNASFLSILDPGFAYVDATLAPFYGAASPNSGFNKISLGPESTRAGLLTEPALLAASSRAAQTSPTLRGIFIAALVCYDTPPPPADANANLPERPPGVSRRDQLEAHISQPVCAGCHQAIDPIGFGLEGFDALGQHQTEPNGAAVNTKGSYFQTPFEGARELSRLVAADPRLAACIARKAYMHGLSRNPGSEEEALIEPLAAGFAAGGHDLAALLGEVAGGGLFLLAPRPIEP